MLRMGRSPKVESNEVQPPPQARPPQPSQPATPQVSSAAQAQAPHAAQTYATPERPAQTPGVAPSPPRAVTESEALARDLRDGVVSGFVGGGTLVSGDAEFKGMLRIDGRFTGRVRSEKGSLIVSAGGVVDAQIEVATAKINGTVNGDIIATERVEFGRSARVRGDIQTPALVIEDGAVFEGNCRMRKAQEPEPKEPKRAEAEPKRAETEPMRVEAEPMRAETRAASNANTSHARQPAAIPTQTGQTPPPVVAAVRAAEAASPE
jgi:cytoskeletal protein CcmA (bactofilin family)